MANRPLLALMLVLALVVGPMAGCIGEDGLDVLPERKGVPGGLTLACLRGG